MRLRWLMTVALLLIVAFASTAHAATRRNDLPTSAGGNLDSCYGIPSSYNDGEYLNLLLSLAPITVADPSTGTIYTAHVDAYDWGNLICDQNSRVSEDRTTGALVIFSVYVTGPNGGITAVALNSFEIGKRMTDPTFNICTTPGWGECNTSVNGPDYYGFLTPVLQPAPSPGADSSNTVWSFGISYDDGRDPDPNGHSPYGLIGDEAATAVPLNSNNRAGQSTYIGPGSFGGVGYGSAELVANGTVTCDSPAVGACNSISVSTPYRLTFTPPGDAAPLTATSLPVQTLTPAAGHDNSANPILVSGSSFQGIYDASQNFPSLASGQPVNSDGTSAIGVTFSCSDVSATTELFRPVFFKWVAPSTTPVTVTTAGSHYDTVLSVSGGNVAACNDDYDPAGIGVVTSSVTFLAVAGTTYQFQVSEYPPTPTDLGTLTGSNHLFIGPLSGDSALYLTLAAQTANGTTTTLTSSGNPQAAATDVTFIAAVADATGAGVPTGMVSFAVDGGTPSVVTLDSTGHALYSTASLVYGTHSIMANYSGDSNNAASYGTLTEVILPAAPVFSPAAGVYPSTQTVTITDPTQYAAIYYTLDGSVPTTNSMFYSGPITVSSTETIRAIADEGYPAPSPVASANYTITSTPGQLFVPVTPCRVADTRGGPGAFGGPEVYAGTSREFDIPDSACGIPSTATAYSLNVTVVPDNSLNYLTIWPSGTPQPYVSTLNSYDGRVKANAAIVPAGTNGGVSVFVSDASQVILDIDGYFAAAETPSALAFYPLTPCRAADTRNVDGALGGPFIAGQGSRSFPVQSSACGVPAAAQAYSLNVTALAHTTLDYLTIWPTGQMQPYVSTLNALTGAVTANAAIVPAGDSGAVSVFVSDDADVVLDINGYFAPPAAGGLSFYSATPCRELDTRSATGAFNGVLLGIQLEMSTCDVRPSAQAYVLNATVVPTGPLNYLTLWPDGESQPYVSTLNADDGSITSNLAIVPIVDGTADAFSSNPTQLILDLSGYFAP